MKKKILAFVFISIVLCLFFIGQGHDLSFFRENLGQIQNYYNGNKPVFVLGYGLIYVLVTALSLPFATVLSLIGGAVFGLWIGSAIIAISSTIGATIAMLIARYFLQEYFSNRFKDMTSKVQSNFESGQLYYLASLRLAPIFPFFIINALFGLTKIKLTPYFCISLISMLPGILIYVNAGEKLGTLSSVRDVLNFDVFLSLVLLGLFPLMIKKILNISRFK